MITPTDCPNCDHGIVEGRDQYGRPTVWPCASCEAGNRMAEARELAAADAEIVAPAEQAGRAILASWPVALADDPYRAAVARVNALNDRWNEAALLDRLVTPIDYDLEDARLDAWLEEMYDLRASGNL